MNTEIRNPDTSNIEPTEHGLKRNPWENFWYQRYRPDGTHYCIYSAEKLFLPKHT